MISKRHEESTVGRRVHVSGDRLNGFALELIREYDVSKHRSVGSRMFPIGSIPATHIQPDVSQVEEETIRRDSCKDDEDGGGLVDNEPRDVFERACVQVEVPGPSLNHVSNNQKPATGKRSQVEVRDCQWWVRQVVQELTTAGILESLLQADGQRSKDPNELVAQLPVH